MAAKLKTLKVAELKDILTTASVPFQQRANKSDLIAKILASQPALNAFNKIHAQDRVSHQKQQQPAQTDDLLAPPEDVDWNTDAVDPPPIPKSSLVKDSQKTFDNASKPATTPASSTTKPTSPATVPSPKKAASSTASLVPAPISSTSPPPAPGAVTPNQPISGQTPAAAAEDDELTKRKKRAERFGIPLVQPSKPKQVQASKSPQNPAARVSPLVDPLLLAARAERFKLNTATSAPPPKRPSPAGEAIDKEELERRAKRAKRFAP